MFDASGRLTVGFGSTAFTGAASSVQVRSATIGGYLYWTFSVSAGSAGTRAIDPTSAVLRVTGAGAPNNVLVGVGTEFSTPNTMAAFTGV
jgi:hypothetical protein